MYQFIFLLFIVSLNAFSHITAPSSSFLPSWFSEESAQVQWYRGTVSHQVKLKLCDSYDTSSCELVATITESYSSNQQYYFIPKEFMGGKLYGNFFVNMTATYDPSKTDKTPNIMIYSGSRERDTDPSLFTYFGPIIGFFIAFSVIYLVCRARKSQQKPKPQQSMEPQSRVDMVAVSSPSPGMNVSNASMQPMYAQQPPQQPMYAQQPPPGYPSYSSQQPPQQNMYAQQPPPGYPSYSSQQPPPGYPSYSNQPMSSYNVPINSSAPPPYSDKKKDPFTHEMYVPEFPEF